MQGVTVAPSISSPTPGQVIDYEENGVGAVAAISASGTPTPTLSLTGTDAALFDISGTDLVWLSSPDYDDPQDSDGDNVYDVTVVADNGEGSFEVSFAVRVTNVVDVAPTITFPTATPVQVPSGRAVAFNARSSDDATTRTWSITAGADAALFSIDANTGRVSFVAAPDYDMPADANTDNDYELTISVTTSGGTDTQSVTVRVVEGSGSGSGIAYPVTGPIAYSVVRNVHGDSGSGGGGTIVVYVTARGEEYVEDRDGNLIRLRG